MIRDEQGQCREEEQAAGQPEDASSLAWPSVK